MTNYWLTFMAPSQHLSERLAVLIHFDLKPNTGIASARAPALGIEIVNEPLALLYVMNAVKARVKATHRELCAGVLTQAMYSETRPLLLAERGEVVFTDDYYAEQDAKCQKMGRRLCAHLN